MKFLNGDILFLEIMELDTSPSFYNLNDSVVFYNMVWPHLNYLGQLYYLPIRDGTTGYFNYLVVYIKCISVAVILFRNLS